jgi:hypothetical protein
MKKPDPTTQRKPTSRRRRVQRVFEGVVASYIHEISGRTHPATAEARPGS